jgi:hypothetical protein
VKREKSKLKIKKAKQAGVDLCYYYSRIQHSKSKIINHNMACNFSIAFPGTAAQVIAKAKAAVEKQGGSFIGNEIKGDFGVSLIGKSVKGNYTITGQQLNITITDKPFIVPCSTIESFLKQQIGA